MASTPAAASHPTWLTGFDPSNAASIAASLKALLAKPATSSSLVPAGFNVLAPATLKPKAAPGPSVFQQALSAFKVTADTFLIQSAINGYQPLAAPAAFGSAQSYYQGLNTTAQTILAAGKSGQYGNVNALA